MRRKSVFLILFLLLEAVCSSRWACYASGTDPAHVYATWEGFEADKCASIWLIKRFINKDAAILILPKGEPITEGIPFDTPDATLRRYQNMSTFESFLKRYELKDPKLIDLGKIVNDIEVNTWERKRFEETAIVRDAVNQIISDSKSNDEAIEKSLNYFDLLYETLQLRPR